MSAIWVGVVLAGCVTTTVITLSSWRHRLHMADLGSVSEGWLAEQRAADRHYWER
jgi:carbon starvation protein CstA